MPKSEVKKYQRAKVKRRAPSVQRWREQKYGRLSGADIESFLGLFRVVWADRQEWVQIEEDEERWNEVVTKLIPVGNWTSFYQDTLFELIAKVAVVAGLGEKIIEAAKSDNPSAILLRGVDEVPDDAPEHPASIPLAFAMMGNLDAIARYSRSINDMISECKQGNLQALFDALSVDSYISTMPFFQVAMRLGQLSGDQSFADAVFKAIKGPHKKRLVYPELRWIEYLLRDQEAFTSCSREDIYELVVQHLGVYDPSGAKKDAKAALFALFRAWQKEAGIQNPRFGFSAGTK